MIELVIVLPLLFVLGLGGIELARALRAYEAVVSLSRELALASFRECVVDPTQTSGSKLALTHKALFNANDCLANTGGTLSSRLTNTVPGAQFAISMYSSVSGSVNRAGYYKSGTAESALSVGSFQGPTNTTGSIGSPGDPGSLANALRDYQLLVVAEVFLPYDPIFRRFLSLLLFDPDRIYGITVL